jgi:glycine/D-amino acid oxidase-like deaminating enzyme
MPAQGGSLSKHPVPADVVVVGAGVIGLSVAWRAAGRGLRVLVLERGPVGHGTSHYAAGMLAPIAEVTPGEEPLLELGLRSARLYPRFIADLVEATGIDDVGYTRCGTLLVARDADEAEARRRSTGRSKRRRSASSRSTCPTITPWTPASWSPPWPARSPRPAARCANTRRSPVWS